MSEAQILCRRCGQPVVKNAALAVDVFEGMHWLCFHLEYEHRGDPDEACSDPSCHWWQLEVLRERLRALGVDPDEALREAFGRLLAGQRPAS